MPCLSANDDFFAFIADDRGEWAPFLVEDVNHPVANHNRDKAVRGPEVEPRDHPAPPARSLRRVTSPSIALSARSTNSSATPVLPARRAWSPSLRSSTWAESRLMTCVLRPS